MSHKTTRNLAVVAASASAAVTVGSFALPVAHAETCTVDGGYLRFDQAFGPYHTTTSVEAKGSALGPGVVTVPPSGTNPTYGTASGSIDGRTISVHIVWRDNKGTADFTGTIADDGTASGNSTGTPIPVHLWDPGPWTATGLKCGDDQGPGNQNAAQGTVNASVDLYDVPGGDGNVVGRLDKGDKVTFNGPCPIQSQDANNGWCTVTDTTKNLSGAVWGEFITK